MEMPVETFFPDLNHLASIQSLPAGILPEHQPSGRSGGLNFTVRAAGSILIPSTSR